jgi:hypothetical protein
MTGEDMVSLAEILGGYGQNAQSTNEVELGYVKSTNLRWFWQCLPSNSIRLHGSTSVGQIRIYILRKNGLGALPLYARAFRNLMILPKSGQ